MQQFLKHYRVKIRVLSPIHIGSGEKIKKKEYIYMPWNHRVIIPNVEKMYEDVCARGWEKEFTSFLMDSRNGEMPLSTWLAQKKLREADYEAWKLYEMDAGEAFVDCTSPPKEIDAFVKDAYGLPYVPGSSVKGMFRTALLVWEIKKKAGGILADLPGNPNECTTESQEEGLFVAGKPKIGAADFVYAFQR